MNRLYVTIDNSGRATLTREPHECSAYTGLEFADVEEFQHWAADYRGHGGSSARELAETLYQWEEEWPGGWVEDNLVLAAINGRRGPL